MAQCIWHLTKTDDLKSLPKSLPFFDLILSITKTINHKNKNPSCDFNWRIFCVYFEKADKWYLYKNQIYNLCSMLVGVLQSILQKQSDYKR